MKTYRRCRNDIHCRLSRRLSRRHKRNVSSASARYVVVVGGRGGGGDRIADNLEFIDGTNCSESLDEWDALVAGWKSPANGGEKEGEK